MIQTDTSYQTNSSERPTSLVSRFGSSGFHKPMSPSMEVSLFSRRQKLIQKRAQVFKSMENLSYDPDRDSSDRDTDGVCSRFALQSPAATTHNYHANSKDYYSRSTAFPSAAAEVASHPSKDGAARRRPEHTVMFALFDLEEYGGQGSKEFVERILIKSIMDRWVVTMSNDCTCHNSPI